jgi:probable phosphoglycerate mutase
VVVSHGGVARATLALRCGIARTEAPVIDIWQGRILIIEGSRHSWA